MSKKNASISDADLRSGWNGSIRNCACENPVKGEFFRQNFSIGEMIDSEKVGSLSVTVEIYYVNYDAWKSE